MHIKDPIIKIRNSAYKILRRNRLAFFIVLFLLGLGYILNVYSNYIFKSDAEWAAHSIRVTNEINVVQLNQKEEDVGIRGLLLATNQQELNYYKDHYRNALAQILSGLDSVRNMMADNPEQEARLKLFDSLIRVKSKLTDRLFTMKVNHADTSVIRRNSDSLMSLRDSIQVAANSILSAETGLLRDRDEKFNRASETTAFIDGVVFVFTCITFILSYILLARELNRRRANERKLRIVEEELQLKVSELQKSNEDLEQFAVIASHDLQEPLRKIQAFGDRLKAKFDGQLDAEAREYITKMQAASLRMSTLIKDLLDYSRISDAKELNSPVNFTHVISDLLQDFDYAIQQKKALVQCEPLPTLMANASQIKRLFSNLISNSLKFSRKDVPPVIKIWCEQIRGEKVKGLIPYKNYYQISVSDNGIGFDELNLDKIFTLFKRLHGRSEYEGTGIGLAVCKKIAINHEGAISAKSSIGKGTTFLIYLPETTISINRV